MSDLSMTKNGIEVPVHVNTVFEGRFEATVGNDRLTAATWPELEKLVDKATKKVTQKIDVPFTSVEFSQRFGSNETKTTVRHGSATGLHSSNGHVLARWDNGEKGQLTGCRDGGSTHFKRLSDQEINEYARLYRAAQAAKQLVDEWETAHKIDLKATVIKELNNGS